MNRSIRTSTLLVSALSILGLAGIVVYSGYNLLPAASLFEVVFLAVVIANPRLPPPGICVVMTLAGLYLFYFLFTSTHINHISFEDSLLAVKFVFYIMTLCLLPGRVIFTAREIELLLKVLIGFFLFKYTVSLVFGLGSRPGLYAENNFELLLLLFSLFAHTLVYGKLKVAYFAAVLAIFLLSGSRSGMLAFFISAPFFLSKMGAASWGLRKLGLAMAVATIILIATTKLFLSRYDDSRGLESVDRFVFLLIFLQETSDWGLRDYFFGSPPLTPLSSLSCSALSFYEKAFSLSGNGQCFSVILHSMILRIVFDHGLLGLFALICTLYYILKVARVPRGASTTIILVLLANGLSVSSFNSIFAALGLAVVMTSKISAGENPPKQTHDIAHCN